MQLPGTIGFAHGRPSGFDDREQAHPFISHDNNLGYIANGRTGQYKGRTDDEAHGNKLLRAGHCFRSACQKPANYTGDSPILDDGLMVHGSDIKCHEIEATYNRLADSPHRLRDAMQEVYETYPSEIVGLCLRAKRPDEIVAARHNLPLEIGRDNDGAIYIASTSIAFPESVSWQTRMPPHSAASVKRDGSIDITPFTNPDLIPMGETPSPKVVNREVCELLQKRGPLNIPELFDEVQNIWPQGVLGEKEIVTFEALDALLKEKRVEFETRRILGIKKGTTAPRIWVHWRNPAQTRVAKSAKVENAKVHVRDATENDIEAIARITGAAFGPMSMERIAEDYFGVPLSEAGWEANKSTEVADEARSGAYQFILAEQDGEAVGYASWSYDEKRDLATVGHNAVLPEYQGRGIGSALQREILRRFHEAGYTRWKVTTLAHDYPAQRIYEKMGFEEVGRSVVYLRREPTIN